MATFAALKSHKPGETNYVSGDIKIFVELLQYIVNKELVDPSNMFKKVCNQYPFEFLLLCDFCRENWKKCSLKFWSVDATRKNSMR